MLKEMHPDPGGAYDLKRAQGQRPRDGAVGEHEEQHEGVAGIGSVRGRGRERRQGQRKRVTIWIRDMS